MVKFVVVVALLISFMILIVIVFSKDDVSSVGNLSWSVSDAVTIEHEQNNAGNNFSFRPGESHRLD